MPGSFPSAESPVGDMSLIRGVNEGPDGQPRQEYVRRLAGFATDGVARVGVVFRDGSVHWTPVVGNVYADDKVPYLAAAALIAEDVSGRRVYERQFRP